MILVVDNAFIKGSFLSFLKKRMLMYAMRKVSRERLILFDELFKSWDITKNISTMAILQIAFSNLSHIRGETSTSISISSDVVYPGTRWPISDLCRIINYGTIDIPPYPIVSDVFEHFSQNIKSYEDKFLMGLG